ncbi:MAG: hypothetical protein AB7P14_18870 [Blastocatellales bacterium]
MKLISAPINWRTFVILFSASMLLGACAAAPKEVSQGESAGSTSSVSSSPPATSSSGLAIGHDSGSSPSGATVPMQSGGTSSALKWTAPTRWQTGPEKPMRAATYLIPAAAGDAEGAECAVFAGIGGGVQANIDRWIGQFQQPDGSDSSTKAKQKKETINGFQVTTVDLTGTFAGGGMAMGQQSAPKTGYRLLGAIVEGPQGEVFFKMTGPAKTIAAAQSEFQSLLKSIK